MRRVSKSAIFLAVFSFAGAGLVAWMGAGFMQTIHSCADSKGSLVMLLITITAVIMFIASGIISLIGAVTNGRKSSNVQSEDDAEIWS